MLVDVFTGDEVAGKVPLTDREPATLVVEGDAVLIRERVSTVTVLVLGLVIVILVAPLDEETDGKPASTVIDPEGLDAVGPLGAVDVELYDPGAVRLSIDNEGREVTETGLSSLPGEVACAEAVTLRVTVAFRELVAVRTAVVVRDLVGPTGLTSVERLDAVDPRDPVAEPAEVELADDRAVGNAVLDGAVSKQYGRP